MLKLMGQRGFAPIILLVAVVAAMFFGLKNFPNLLPNKPPQPLTSPQAKQEPVQKPKDEKKAQENLEKYLTVEAALLGVSDNISLYFKDLDGGKEVSIQPSRSWIPASTIKSFVVLEAFRQKNLGLVDFNKEITIDASNVVPTELETDEFPKLREGTKATIKQLVEAMVIQSDNTAYNTLLDILDRRNVNLSLRQLGITETVVGEKLNLDEGQYQKGLTALGRQSNTTTVKDLATFFEALYNKKIAGSDEIVSIFKRQKINNMIPALLPKETAVAHKTGEWAQIYHDGGVVFKPDDPFILTVFTNSGDPTIVAQMAKVAFYQDAASVGKNISSAQVAKPVSDNRPVFFLAQNPLENSVLAAESNNEKFPEITASDLGIGLKDLNSNLKDAENLRAAFIIPGSLLYDIKKFFETRGLQNATGSGNQTRIYLSHAKSRLSEAKRLLGDGNLDGADKLLKESESDLESSVSLAQKDPDKDRLLLEIKQVNDLHFAALAERANQIPDSKKEQFVDSVYNFYQQNRKEVKSVINTSVIANPLRQKPAVGTISQVSGNEATLKFDDGSTKQILLTDDTKVRTFQQDNYQGSKSVSVGDKVAVMGLTNSKSQIIPQFILKDIPKELPQKHTGIIIEINPGQNSLKILDKSGQVEEIKVGDKTNVKSSDTNVSLEGIKAGSQVTVFGTSSQKPSSVTPSTSPPPSQTDHPVQIKASTVIVTKNSSGSKEKTSPPPPSSKSSNDQKGGDNKKPESKSDSKK